MATKEDLHGAEVALKENIRNVEGALRKQIHSLEVRITNLRSELKEDMLQLRQEMIKFKSDVRLYFLILLGVVIITNPKVIELIAKLLALLK